MPARLPRFALQQILKHAAPQASAVPLARRGLHSGLAAAPRASAAFSRAGARRHASGLEIGKDAVKDIDVRLGRTGTRWGGVDMGQEGRRGERETQRLGLEV